jgi:hypothetical protein
MLRHYTTEGVLLRARSSLQLISYFEFDAVVVAALPGPLSVGRAALLRHYNGF